MENREYTSESTLFLEEKYKSRGLKFDGIFWRSHPTQAYGEVDGMLFYFRLKYEFATLTVGLPFMDGDEVLENSPDIVIQSSYMENAPSDWIELTTEQEIETFSYLLENLVDYKETKKQKASNEDYRQILIENRRRDEKYRSENPGGLELWEHQLLEDCNGEDCDYC